MTFLWHYGRNFFSNLCQIDWKNCNHFQSQQKQLMKYWTKCFFICPRSPDSTQTKGQMHVSLRDPFIRMNVNTFVCWCVAFKSIAFHSHLTFHLRRMGKGGNLEAHPFPLLCSLWWVETRKWCVSSPSLSALPSNQFRRRRSYQEKWFCLKLKDTN